MLGGWVRGLGTRETGSGGWGLGRRGQEVGD